MNDGGGGPARYETYGNIVVDGPPESRSYVLLVHTKRYTGPVYGRLTKYRVYDVSFVMLTRCVNGRLRHRVSIDGNRMNHDGISF